MWFGKASENSRCYLKKANKDHYSQRKQQSKGRTAPAALTVLALIERRQAVTGLQGQLLELVCHCFAVRAGGETWQGSRVVLSIRCPHVIHRVKSSGERESKRSFNHTEADKINKERKKEISRRHVTASFGCFLDTEDSALKLYLHHLILFHNQHRFKKNALKQCICEQLNSSEKFLTEKLCC